MIVLTIIFSTLFKGWGVENYPIYLLTGLLIFTFFSGANTAAMRSIRGSAGILKNSLRAKIYLLPFSNIIKLYNVPLITCGAIFSYGGHKCTIYHLHNLYQFTYSCTSLLHHWSGADSGHGECFLPGS